jgi:hypothetical protein
MLQCPPRRPASRRDWQRPALIARYRTMRALSGGPTGGQFCRRASKPQFQNDSGLPQGPADPCPGRLLMRQTACVRRIPSWYDRRRHPWEGAPWSA